MKKQILLCCSIFLLSGLQACQEKKNKDQVQINSLDATNRTQNSDLSNYSPIFQSILKSDAGMARGVSLGDNFEGIKETTLPSETQPDNGRSYTEYFDNTDLNFADILYSKDKANKVSEITIDVYIEKQPTVDSLYQEFKTFFSKKYGIGTDKPKATSWQLAEGKQFLILQNVSTQKDPGFKIIFANKSEKEVQ
ncbi:MAG: hypothetical protein ACOVQ4_13185 [Flectobacillus sp.]|uniref:hypothetical protein n=1 Tax=Flectobacillus sp. TaxID=50419 RepID=UPI003B9BBAE1